MQVRGTVDEEPHRVPTVSDPLRSMDTPEHTITVLVATHLRDGDRWDEVTGRVLLTVTGAASELHAGDEVEVTGRLVQLSGPANPGEFDVAALMRDQGVRCRIEGARLRPASRGCGAAGRSRSAAGWA